MSVETGSTSVTQDVFNYIFDLILKDEDTH